MGCSARPLAGASASGRSRPSHQRWCDARRRVSRFDWTIAAADHPGWQRSRSMPQFWVTARGPHRASLTFASQTERTSRSRICSSDAASRLPSTSRSPRPRPRWRRFRRRTGAVGRCIALRCPNAACRRGRSVSRRSASGVPTLGAGWRRSPGGSEQAGSLCSTLSTSTMWRRTDEQAVAPALTLQLGPMDATALPAWSSTKATTRRYHSAARDCCCRPIDCDSLRRRAGHCGFSTAARLPSAAALRFVAARAETHGRARDRGEGRSSRAFGAPTPSRSIPPRWFWAPPGVRPRSCCSRAHREAREASLRLWRRPSHARSGGGRLTVACKIQKRSSFLPSSCKGFLFLSDQDLPIFFATAWTSSMTRRRLPLQSLRDLRLGVAAADELERDVERLVGAVPAVDAAAAVEVRRDADVIDADHLHGVVDVIDEVLDRRARGRRELRVDRPRPSSGGPRAARRSAPRARCRARRRRHGPARVRLRPPPPAPPARRRGAPARRRRARAAPAARRAAAAASAAGRSGVPAGRPNSLRSASSAAARSGESRSSRSC